MCSSCEIARLLVSRYKHVQFLWDREAVSTTLQTCAVRTAIPEINANRQTCGCNVLYVFRAVSRVSFICFGYRSPTSLRVSAQCQNMWTRPYRKEGWYVANGTHSTCEAYANARRVCIHVHILCVYSSTPARHIPCTRTVWDDLRPCIWRFPSLHVAFP